MTVALFSVMAHGLTLAWLAVWIAAQALCFRLRPHRNALPLWRMALLVSCLTILLFPLISSDDDAAWARQMQSDFDLAGVTQATRGFSRYDLPDLLHSSSSPQPRFLCPDPDHVCCVLEQDRAETPVVPFLQTVSLLRAPPFEG